MAPQWFRMVQTMTTVDKLQKTVNARLFRKCPGGAANPRSQEFLTDMQVTQMCVKAPCDELERVLNMSSGKLSMGGHQFSDDGEPKSMLAIDIKFSKTIAVKHCSQQFCNSQKQEGGNDHLDCTDCDGKTPTAQQDPHGGAPTGPKCSCFDYNVTKSCELWGNNNHLKLNTVNVTSDTGSATSTEEEILLMDNRGIRDMCAML